MATAYLLVEIDGQPLYQFSEDVLMEQVDVVQEINKHWWCYIRCRQTEDRRFPAEDALGKDLQVSAFDEDGTQTYLFSGMVLESELEYEIYGSFTARITGVSKSYNMDVAPRQQYYELGKNTFANIVNDATGRAGLSPNGNLGNAQFPAPIVQWGETDFNLVVRCADDDVHWVNPDAQDGTILNVRKVFDDGPTLQWRTEDQLLSFRVKGKLAAPKMDGAFYNWIEGLSKTYNDVPFVPDFLGGASMMVGKVTDQSQSKVKNGYVVDQRGVLTLDEFNMIVAREADRSIHSSVSGYGVSLNPEVAAGKKVTIQGLQDAEGTYGVYKAAHHWTPAGYTNEFWCSAWTNYRNPERPKSNPWYGIVIGRVFDNNDPDNMGRLKVQYVWQEQSQTFWARLMMPHAGASRGVFFVPEIGDEVVIAFEDGDPERPVVLGCLWNHPNTPPTEDFWGGEYAKDDVKRIITKSGHRIQMVDKEGKESITIATPTHIKISMLENTNENGRATLLLHSDGDIILDAGGRIHCKSAFFSREVG